MKRHPLSSSMGERCEGRRGGNGRGEEDCDVRHHFGSPQSLGLVSTTVSVAFFLKKEKWKGREKGRAGKIIGPIRMSLRSNPTLQGVGSGSHADSSERRGERDARLHLPSPSRSHRGLRRLGFSSSPRIGKQTKFGAGLFSNVPSFAESGNNVQRLLDREV